MLNGITKLDELTQSVTLLTAQRLPVEQTQSVKKCTAVMTSVCIHWWWVWLAMYSWHFLKQAVQHYDEITWVSLLHQNLCRKNVDKSASAHWGSVIQSAVFFVVCLRVHWVSQHVDPGICEWNSRLTIFKLICMIDSWGVSCQIALRRISSDLTDDK